MSRWFAIAAMVLAVGLAGDVAAQGQGRGRAGAPGQQKPATPAAAEAKPSPGAGPIVVVETANKGTFEFETYPNEAPKSVDHILALAKGNFYNGQRVHRVVKGQLVQFGDPLSRDMSKRAYWGTGGSGKPIGVSEVSPKRKHLVGSVALAHSGNPPCARSASRGPDYFTVTRRMMSVSCSF